MRISHKENFVYHHTSISMQRIISIVGNLSLISSKR